MDFKTQERIFKNWMNQHKGLLIKIVRSYAKGYQDQDDLFQEIAIQVWLSIPSFQGKSSEATWIYRVSLFKALSWTRKEKNSREKRERITKFRSFLHRNPENENPRLAWLYDQINLLRPIDRSLTLLFLDGYSYKEMAAMLGLSESNVGVRINRIKTRLTEESEKTEVVEK